MILFYVSGHGLGHCSREIEVIKAIHKINPNLPIGLKTPTASWFVKSNLPDYVIYEESTIDIGVLQSDSITVKPCETLKAYSELIANKESIIEKEVKWCSEHNVKLIVADIPPIAFNISDKLGIPSIAVCNFTWDWIYSPYVREFPQFEHVLEDIRESESFCDLCLYTPLDCDLSAFHNRQPIPLIGRKSNKTVGEIRKKLGIAEDTNLILYSFGGVGINRTNILEPDLDIDTIILSTNGEKLCDNWMLLKEDEMKKMDVKYQDLVNAADAVLTKTGYGIVSECITNRTGIIHVSRDNFIESGVIAEEMKKYIPAIEIPKEDFFLGRWREYFELLQSDEKPRATISTDGAEKAAERIISFL